MSEVRTERASKLDKYCHNDGFTQRRLKRPVQCGAGHVAVLALLDYLDATAHVPTTPVCRAGRFVRVQHQLPILSSQRVCDPIPKLAKILVEEIIDFSSPRLIYEDRSNRVAVPFPPDQKDGIQPRNEGRRLIWHSLRCSSCRRLASSNRLGV